MGFATLVTAAATILYARRWPEAMAVPLPLVILLNARFYWFFLTHRGLLFTAAVLPMQVLYYLYSAAVFVLQVLAYWLAPAAEPTAAVTAANVTAGS